MNSFSIPGLDLYNLYQLLISFFFSSLRISALLISMPFFSISFIPLQARIVLAMSISIFIFPFKPRSFFRLCIDDTPPTNSEIAPNFEI